MNFSAPGFGGPQLVHEQHVAAAVFEGCHAQRVEAFRGERAAVEQEIVRGGRGVRHRQQVDGGAGQDALHPAGAEAAGGASCEKVVDEGGFAHALFPREEQVVSAWDSHGAPPCRLRRVARTQIISPVMETAISSGVTALMAVPMGVWTEAMASSVMPASRRRWLT